MGTRGGTSLSLGNGGFPAAVNRRTNFEISYNGYPKDIDKTRHHLRFFRRLPAEAMDSRGYLEKAFSVRSDRIKTHIIFGEYFNFPCNRVSFKNGKLRRETTEMILCDFLVVSSPPQPP